MKYPIFTFLLANFLPQTKADDDSDNKKDDPFGDKAPQDCGTFDVCKAGRVAVQSHKKTFASNGCDDMGMSMFSVGGGSGNKKTEKCCIGLDVCHQSCGADMVKCQVEYKDCVKKKCGADSTCNMMGMMATMSASRKHDEQELRKFMNATELAVNETDYSKTSDAKVCAAFRKTQRDYCRCVKPENKDQAFEEAVEKFYKTIKEKPKNMKKVKSTWAGKEDEMFKTLANKYRKKGAVRVSKSDQAKKMEEMMASINSGGMGAKGAGFPGSGGGGKFTPPSDYSDESPPAREEDVDEEIEL